MTINTSSVRVHFALLWVVAAQVLFWGNHYEIEVLVIYTAHSKDVTQFYQQLLRTHAKENFRLFPYSVYIYMLVEKYI